MKLPFVQLSPFCRYFIPLRSKYSPQHPVLTYPQSVFDRPLMLGTRSHTCTKQLAELWFCVFCLRS
jgi:hypothetical protein